jgi:hypothetical protein
MATTPQPSTGVAGLDVAIIATGFRWRAEPKFNLASVKGKIQHRHSDKEDPRTVRRYAAMFKAGSVPPPIGVTRDDYVIWGNHRIAGAELAGWGELPATVIDVDYAGADEHLTNQLLSLSVAENAPHGVPYNNDDRHDRARTLLELGYTTATIQRALGLTPAQISGIRREAEGVKRLEALGMPTFDKQNLRQAFASPAVKALNDDPFKALAVLAKDAGLKSGEIEELARSMKATGADADALVLVQNVRDDQQQRIAEVATGGVQRPTPVGKLITALKAVITLCDSAGPTVYIDRTAKAAATKAMIHDALICLGSIEAVQIPDDEDEVEDDE